MKRGYFDKFFGDRLRHQGPFFRKYKEKINMNLTSSLEVDQNNPDRRMEKYNI